MKRQRQRQRQRLQHIALTPIALAAIQWFSAGTAAAQTQPAPAEPAASAPAEAGTPAAAAEPSPAAAAPAGLETVVITSRRIKEKQQDVPISVSAFSAAQIQAAGITGMEDVARLTPGFSFERTTGSLTQPTIRGQAQSRAVAPVQNVATFFNGLYLQRAYQVDSDMLGLERVEVIKGPQSALFGRNAFAGAISYVTQKPNLDRTILRGEATLGNNERRDLKVLASVPLSEQAAFSVAASTSEFDGTWANNNPLAPGARGPAVRTRGNLNGYDNKSALLQLRLQPDDSTEFSIFHSTRSLKTESPANYQMGARGVLTNYNNMNCRPFEAALQPALGVNALHCGALSAKPVIAPGEPRNPGLVADARAYGQDTTSHLTGLTWEWMLTDKYTLNAAIGRTSANSSNVATLSRDAQRGIEAAPPFLANAIGRVLFDSRGNGDIETESYELRLTYDTRKLRYMLGAYLADVSDFDYGVSYAALPGSGAPLSTAQLAAGGDVVFPGFSATQRDENVYAFFGSVTIEPLTDLRITAEARETSEKIVQQARTFPDRAPNGRQFERTFRYFTPRLTTDWRLSPAAMVYASAAKGVKSGGFNAGARLEVDRVFEPEKNWTYELGLKTNTADGSLLFNVAGYLVDWTNLQGNRPETGGTFGSPAVIGNVSGADVKGLEATLRWRPVRALTLDASLAYTQAEFKKGAVDSTIARSLCTGATAADGTCPFSPLGNIGGKTVPRSPGTTAALAGTWRSNVGSDLTLTTRADVSYQGKSYTDPTNTAWAPARTLINGSIGLESTHWSLRLWGRNLADREYVSYAFTTFGGGGAASGVTYAPLLGDRRTVGATLSLDY